MYPSLFARDLFSEMDRVHREWRRVQDTMSPSIRGLAQGFPALNVGTTPTSVEIYAFAPGIDPRNIQLDLDRRVLTIAGERHAAGAPAPATTEASSDAVPATRERSLHHVAERFTGRFKRIVSLPDDIDTDAISADYKDGVLHVSVKRRESAQPRRIAVQ
jgi:HSP20 family protein